MPGAPLTDPDLFPLHLEDLFVALADRELFKHLSVSRTNEGEWQASFKNPEDKAYSVSIKPNMIEAILAAVGPCWGKTWPDLLGPEYEEVFDGVSVDDDDDDEELEDVLG